MGYTHMINIYGILEVVRVIQTRNTTIDILVAKSDLSLKREIQRRMYFLYTYTNNILRRVSMITR